jgi:hypothetical protein
MKLSTFLLTLIVGFALFSGGDQYGYSQDSATEIELYKAVTLSMTVDPSLYVNPFDSRDIELIGIFQSPSGEQRVVAGFWMQPYDDAMQPNGEPGWYVRFTPSEPGNWTYVLQVRNNGELVDTQEGRFSVTPSSRRGFIRVGENRRYFQYDNGEPYFPIGHNLKWSWDGAGGLETYLQWLRELHEMGGNYARLFIDVPWFINLDWAGPAGDYRGAQLAAAQLDRIIEAAAEYDIALQLVLLWHQSILIYNGPPVLIPEQPARPRMGADWDDHPYNIVNGGPLSGPGVFFYNEQAEALLRRRLQYIAARWGYSPQVFAWEIIDRIDRTSNYDPQVANDWLQRTIGYLRRIDSHSHLITVGSRDFEQVIAANPFLDFATLQYYQRLPIEAVTEQVGGIVDLIRRQISLNPIPVLVTDYSLNPWYEPLADDPQGLHVQTTLWAAALAGAAGGAMSDWWDTYIIPQGLGRYYAPLASFSAGIQWSRLNLQPAEAGLVAVDGSDYLPLRLTDYARQFLRPIRDVVRRDITSDGVFPALADVPSYLYGKVFNSQYSQAQLYRVTLPVDTYLEVRVRSVSTQAGARLSIMVDGRETITLDLRAGTRDTAVRLPLAAGERNITLDNTGDDWLEIDYIEIADMIAPARALSLRDAEAGLALAWLQHRDYDWSRAGNSRDLKHFRYRLNRMPAGRYIVEVWDPVSGGIIGEEIVRVRDDGILVVELLPFNRMLVLRASLQLDDKPITDPLETLLPQEFATTTQSPVIVQTNTPQPDVTDR